MIETQNQPISYVWPLLDSSSSRTIYMIVGDPICVCMIKYEAVDHIIWECSRFENERRQLLLGLAAVNVKEGSQIRDLCALQKWAALRLWAALRECGLKIWGDLFFVFRITQLRSKENWNHHILNKKIKKINQSERELSQKKLCLVP
jgi:hypothetical protein